MESLLNKCDPESHTEQKKWKWIKKNHQQQLALCTINKVKENINFLLGDKNHLWLVEERIQLSEKVMTIKSQGSLGWDAIPTTQICGPTMNSYRG